MPYATFLSPLFFAFLLTQATFSLLLQTQSQSEASSYFLDFRQLQNNVANMEFCSIYQPYVNTTNITLILGQSNVIIQSTCEKYFMVPLNQSGLAGNYLLIEMNIGGNTLSSLFTPLFTGRLGQTPYLYYDSMSNFQYQFDFYDQNGFDNSKTYQYLLIAPGNFSLSTALYLGVFEAYQQNAGYVPTSMTYTLTTSASSSPPCPRNCSTKGRCVNGVCMCDDSFIDEDCSVQAYQILFNSGTLQPIQAGSWFYFYYTVSQYNSDLTLTLQKDQGTAAVIVYFQTGDVAYLPNSDNSQTKYYFPSDVAQLTLTILQSTQDNRIGKKTIVGVYNSYSSPINVSAQLQFVQTDDNTRATVMYVLIGVAVFLIVIWGIITIIKYKSYRNTQTFVNAANPNRQGQRQTLTSEEVNEHFPKKKFNQFKTTLEQICCSICLEDFIPDAICRQIICEHIFHDTCIESWLTHHENCPNCKREINKIEIQKWQEEKNRVKIDPSQAKTAVKPEAADITKAAAVASTAPNSNNTSTTSNRLNGLRSSPTNIPRTRPRAAEEGRENMNEVELEEITPLAIQQRNMNNNDRMRLSRVDRERTEESKENSPTYAGRTSANSDSNLRQANGLPGQIMN